MLARWTTFPSWPFTSPPDTLPALFDLSISLSLFSVSVSVHQGDSNKLQNPLRLGQLLTF
jgi:hypothetical protein